MQGQAREGQYGNEDFAGYRPYVTGDSPRHIDWKAVARERGWWTKQFTGGMATEICWLRWQDVQHYPNSEQALSQLSFWVTQAEKTTIRLWSEFYRSTALSRIQVNSTKRTVYVL